MTTFDTPEFENVIGSCKELCKEKMGKPNIFIMACDPGSQRPPAYYEKLLSSLKKDFSVHVFDLSPTKCDLFMPADQQHGFSFQCIAIDSGKSEKIKDIIKEVLWPINNDTEESPTIRTVLSECERPTPEPFKLSEYGTFVPYKSRKFGDIRTHSFHHKPVFYRYRVAVEKLKQLPVKLESYLQLLFTDCPNHLFQKSNYRASARTCDDFNIEVRLKSSQDHELSKLAEKSISFNQFRSRHENLQKYFLMNDPYTVACELPLWLEASELKDYTEVFHTEDILTGHVDVLRFEKDGKIGIWDYKPRAARETDATIQVFLYALMLSIRTGISLKDFVSGYFDETDAVSFAPSDVRMEGE